MTTYTSDNSKAKKRNRLGFTLMELLMVLAIMTILFAIAIPAVAELQKSLQLARLDSHATEVYLAVENRLISMKASGELVELQGEMYNNYQSHNFTQIPDVYPSYTDRYVEEDGVSSFRPQDWLKWTTEDNVIYENFFYLVHTPLDVSGGDDEVMKTIVPTDSVTEAVLSAYYIVEFNPNNGDVYGVFYSETPITEEDVLQLENREKSVRKSTMIGYYTKGYTDVLTRGDMDSYQVNLSFINKEDLYLHIECDVKTTYFDRRNIEAAVVLHDMNDPEGAQYDLTVPLNLDDATIWGKGASTYSTFAVDVLLDSMENGQSFENIFSSTDINGLRNIATHSQNKNCVGTFTPGDDIRATVEMTYKKAGRVVGVDDSNNEEYPYTATENSLFASNKVTDETNKVRTIEVGYVRHLQNLNNYTYAGEPSDVFAGLTVPYQVSVKQTQDIYFSPTYMGSDGAERTLWESDARVGGLMENALSRFTPVNNAGIFENNNPASLLPNNVFDGQGNRLVDFVIAKQNTSAANAGLFESTENVTLRNIVMVNPTVTGGKKVGALAGSVKNTTISNCGVRLETVDPETNVYYSDMEDRVNRYKVTGSEQVGGLVGRAEATTKIVSSYAAVRVEGAIKDSDGTVTYGNSVGGLVGHFHGSNSDADYIKDSYTSEAQVGDSYVGGLVGYGRNFAIDNGYSTGDVLGNRCSGGLVGSYVGTNVVKNSESYGKVTKCDGVTVDTDSSGAIVGESDGTGTVTFTGCRYLTQGGYNDDKAYSSHIPSGVTACEYDALRATPANDTNKSHPYTMMFSTLTFPFEMVTYYAEDDTAKTTPIVLDHYGDWPPEQSVQTSLVYYERYPDGSYGYYTLTSLTSDTEHGNQWLLNTLHNGENVYCVEDGYALLCVYHLTEFTYKLNDAAGERYVVGSNSALFDKSEILSFKFTDADGNAYGESDDNYKERVELVYLYQLPFECQETGTNSQLYDKLVVTTAYAQGNEKLNVVPGYTFYYSPRFAMTAVNPDVSQVTAVGMAGTTETPATSALALANGSGLTTRDVNAISLLGQRALQSTALTDTDGQDTAQSDDLVISDVSEVLPSSDTAEEKEADGAFPTGSVEAPVRLIGVQEAWARNRAAADTVTIQIGLRKSSAWIETVFGEDGGELCLSTVSSNPKATDLLTMTKETTVGRYTLSGLSSGTYYVYYKSASGDIQPIGKYENGKQTIQTASPGSTVTSIQFYMLKLTAGAGVATMTVDGVAKESGIEYPYIKESKLTINVTFEEHYTFFRWQDTYSTSVHSTEQTFQLTMNDSKSLTARAKMDTGLAQLVMSVGGHPDWIESAYPTATGIYLSSDGVSYSAMTRTAEKGTYSSPVLQTGSVYALYWKDTDGEYHQIYNADRDQIGDIPTLQTGQTLYTGFNFVNLSKDDGIDKLFINGQEVESDTDYAFLHGFAYQPLGADGENNFPNQSIVRITCTIKKGYMWHEWTWARSEDGTLHDSYAHVREMSVNVENGAWYLKANTGAQTEGEIEYPTIDLNTLHVRSARQLNALGRYSFTWDWACEVEAFSQDIDINFSKYTTTYCGETLNLTPAAQESTGNRFANVPIGNSGKPFQKIYDGNGNQIYDYCQLNSTDENVGLFGEITSSTVRNVMMVASNGNAATSTAYVKSTKTSTLKSTEDASSTAYDYAADGQPYMTFRDSDCELSVYWWERSDIENATTCATYVDFLKNQGVTRIYLYVSKLGYLNNATDRMVVHTLAQRVQPYGISIMPFYAEAAGVMTSYDKAAATIQNLISGYNAYKAEYPDDLFGGYHFDVIPHQETNELNKFEALTQTNLDHYANNFIRAAQLMRGTGIEIEVNVNCEWISAGKGGENTVYNADGTTGIYNIVAKYADCVCTMAYADTVDGILNMMSDVLDGVEAYNTSFIIGVETGNHAGNEASAEFAQESKEYMYTELEKVYNRLKSTGYGDYISAIAMHNNRTWRAMESRHGTEQETSVPNVGALVGFVSDIHDISKSMTLTNWSTHTIECASAPEGTSETDTTAYWDDVTDWVNLLRGSETVTMTVKYAYKDTAKAPPTSITMNVYKRGATTPTTTVVIDTFKGTSTSFKRTISSIGEGSKITFVQEGGSADGVVVTVSLAATSTTKVDNCCATGYQVIRESDAVFNMTSDLSDIRIQPSVGGLVGYNSGIVDNCYAASREVVIDEPNTYVYRALGGLVGRNSGTVTDSYAGGELKYAAYNEGSGSLANAKLGGVVGAGVGETASVKTCYSYCTINNQSYYKQKGTAGAEADAPTVYAVADTTGNTVRKASYLRGTYQNTDGSTAVYPISSDLSLSDNRTLVQARSEAEMKELLNLNTVGKHSGAKESLAQFCAESLKLSTSDYWVVVDVYGSFPQLKEASDATIELTGYRTYGTNAAVKMEALEVSSSKIRFKVMGPLYTIGTNDFIVTVVGTEGVSKAEDTRMIIQCGRYAQTISTWETVGGVNMTYWEDGKAEVALYGAMFGDDTGAAAKDDSHPYNTKTLLSNYPYPAVVTDSEGAFSHYGDWPNDYGATTSVKGTFKDADYGVSFETPKTYSWNSWSSFISALKSNPVTLHPGDYVELVVEPEYRNPDSTKFGVFECSLNAITGDTNRYKWVNYGNGQSLAFEWVITEDTLLSQNSRVYFYADKASTGAQSRYFTAKSITINIYQAGVEEEAPEYTGTVTVTKDGTPTALSELMSGATGLALSQDGINFINMTETATGTYVSNEDLVGVYNVFVRKGENVIQLSDYQVRNESPLNIGYYTVTLHTSDGVAAVSIGSSSATTGVYLEGTQVTIHATMESGRTFGQWVRANGTPFSLDKDTTFTVTGTTDLTAQENTGGTETGEVQLVMNGTPFSADYVFNFDPGVGGLYLSADGEHYLLMTEDFTAGRYVSNQLSDGVDYNVYWFDGNAYHRLDMMHESTVEYTPTLAAGEVLELHFRGVTISKDKGIDKLYVNGVEVAADTTTAILCAYGPENNTSGSAIVRVAATAKDGYEFTGFTYENGGSAPYSFTVSDNHGGATLHANAKAIAGYTALVKVYKDGTLTDIGDVVAGATGLALYKNGEFEEMTRKQRGYYQAPDSYGTYDLYYTVGDEHFRLGSYQVTSEAEVSVKYYTVTLNAGSGVSAVSLNGSGTTAVVPDGTTVTIDASVEDGYTWEGWSGTASYSERSTSVVVDKTLTLTASAGKTVVPGDDELLSQWRANNNGKGTAGYVFINKYGKLQTYQYSHAASDANGYLTSDPSTNVQWIEFIQQHGNLAEDEYIVLTYEGPMDLVNGLTASGITTLSGVGYTKGGVAVTKSDITDATFTATKIQIRINGPLTVDATQKTLALVISSASSKKADTDITSFTTMTGSIYKVGGSTPTPYTGTVNVTKDGGAAAIESVLTGASGLALSADGTTYVELSSTTTGTYTAANLESNKTYSLYSTSSAGTHTKLGDYQVTSKAKTATVNFYTVEAIAGAGVQSVTLNGNSGSTVTAVMLENAEATFGATLIDGGVWNGWKAEGGTVYNDQSMNLTVTNTLRLTAKSGFTGQVVIRKNNTATTIGAVKTGGTTVRLSADDGATFVNMTYSGGVYTAEDLVPGKTYAIYWSNGSSHTKYSDLLISDGTSVTIDYYTVKLSASTGVTGLTVDGAAVTSGTETVYQSGTTITLGATVNTADGYAWKAWMNGTTLYKQEQTTAITVSSQLDLTATACYNAAVVVRQNETPVPFGSILASAEGLWLMDEADNASTTALAYNVDTKAYTCNGLTPGKRYYVAWGLESTLTRIGNFVIEDGSVLTIDYYTLTLSGDEHIASVSINGETVTAGQPQNCLRESATDTVTISATAASGYVFKGWYKADDSEYSTSATTTVIPDGVLTLTAKSEESSGPVQKAQWTTTNGIGYTYFNGGNAYADVYSATKGTDGTNAKTWTQFAPTNLLLAEGEYVEIVYQGSFPNATADKSTLKLYGFRPTGGSGNVSVTASEASASTLVFRINGPLELNTADTNYRFGVSMTGISGSISSKSDVVVTATIYSGSGGGGGTTTTTSGGTTTTTTGGGKATLTVNLTVLNDKGVATGAVLTATKEYTVGATANITVELPGFYQPQTVTDWGKYLQISEGTLLNGEPDWKVGNSVDVVYHYTVSMTGDKTITGTVKHTKTPTMSVD